MDGGAIAGIVIGCVTAIAVTAGCIYAACVDRQAEDYARATNMYARIGERIEDVALRLGNDYNIVYLRNGEKRYVWRIEGGKNPSELSVSVKDGIVVAVSGSNIG